jgi:serine/threonine-protein kinase
MSSRLADPAPRCPPDLVLRQFVEEELPAEERGGIDAHIDSCPHCQQRLHQLVLSELGPLAGILAPRRHPKADAADDDSPRLDGYEPLGRIDAGGMGVVWRVRDLQFERTLAVKVLKARACDDPNAVRRFLAEAQITGQLTHPFIVPIHAMGRLVDKRPYYTMKLVEGKTLADLLRDRSDPTAQRMELVQVFGQVCQAVAFAHSRGIIHRDLKPANVMVGAHGEVQVMDWGLAKAVAGTATPHPEVVDANETVDDARNETGERTRTGSVLGTWAYMPPEQARGLIAEVDQRSDVFGLGAIFCEVLTGEPPYTGPDARAIRLQATDARLDGALSRLHSCGADPELIQLAEQCLAPRRSDRPADADEVAVAVAAYQAAVQERLQQERLERERQEVKAVEQRRRRKLWLGLSAAVLGMVLLGVGAWCWHRLQVSTREAKGEAALEEVVAASEKQQWPEALAAGRRAWELLDSGPVSRGLKARGAEVLTDVELVVELEQILSLGQEVLINEAPPMARPPTLKGFRMVRGAEERKLAAYQAAFRKYGITASETDPAVAADRIRRRPGPIRAELLAALHFWHMIAQSRGAGETKWVVEVLAATDDDPWRQQVRELLARKDRAALVKTILEADVNAHPAAYLAWLANLLGGYCGDYASSAKVYRRAQQRHPAHFWINWELANSLLFGGQRADVAEAIRFYTAALALRPTRGVVAMNLGAALMEQGRPAEAEAALRRAVALVPNNGLVHYNLAHALHRQQKLQDAETHYREAVACDPSLAYAHERLGWLLFLQQKWPEAERSFERALALDRNEHMAHFNLGVLWQEQGKWPEALGAFDRVVKLEPKLAEAHLNRGMLLFALGRHKESAAAYREAIACKEDYTNAYTYLGNVLTELHLSGGAAQGDLLGEAEKALVKAVKLDPDFAPARHNLGRVWAIRGEAPRPADPRMRRTWLADAEAAFRHAIALESRTASKTPGLLGKSYFCLGLVLEDQGRFVEALAALEQAVRSGHPPLDRMIKGVQRLIELDGQLAPILRGSSPVDNRQRLELAGFCMRHKGLYAAATRLYAEAFKAEPGLIDDLRAQPRYNAACAAALAAAGKGEDAAKTDTKKRAELRRRALDWLRDDLKVWSRHLASDDPRQRDMARNSLRHWQGDPDLTDLRDQAAVAKLPPEEQEACKRLWAEVAELLKKVEGKESKR